jgi:hypothetical protein
MMLKRIPFFIFFLISFSCFSQEEDIKPLRVEGKIMDQRQQIVSYAHILNKERQLGVVGGYDGYFSIGAYPGDTLVISAVSYHNKILIVPDSIKAASLPYLFIMEQDTLMLPEKIIYPWPSTYAEFRKDFLAKEIEDPLENLDLHIPSSQELKALGGSYAITLPGPFSILYSKFSKEAKTRKMMARLNLTEKVELRYNADIISKLTGMKDKEEIRRFMDYCRLQDQFILNATDYELYAAIMDCYKSFSPPDPE